MGWKARCISLLCECLHAFWFQAGNVLWCVWPGQTQEVLNLLKFKNKPKMFGTSQNTHVVSEGEGLDSVLIWHEHHISGKHKQCGAILWQGYTLAFSLMTVSESSSRPGPRGIWWSTPSSFDPFLLVCHRNLCLWTHSEAAGHEHSEAELEVPWLGLYQPAETGMVLALYLDESGLWWALEQPPV